MEHSAIPLTCIKLPPVFKTFILSIFVWLLKTGLTVDTSKYWDYDHCGFQLQQFAQSPVTPCLPMSSADNLCKQLGPRSGPTICRAWSGSKLIDTQRIFWKSLFLKKFILKNISRRQKKKHAKLPSMQWVEINTYSHLVWPVYWSTLHRPLFWQAHVSQVGPW